MTALERDTRVSIIIGIAALCSITLVVGGTMAKCIGMATKCAGVVIGGGIIAAVCVAAWGLYRSYQTTRK